uniref:Uncharacterized protein n=1 Tax=Anguilla anguilla TaxID=7936 RepID=A0A0E9QFN8_ANGAN
MSGGDVGGRRLALEHIQRALCFIRVSHERFQFYYSHLPGYFYFKTCEDSKWVVFS